jgi:hypothetical protein
MKKLSILATAAAAILMTTTASTAYAQAKSTAATQPARIAGKPNLNGIWQVMGTANWDLEPHAAQSGPAGAAGERILGAITAEPAGLGVVEGGTIPYKPEAREVLNRNKANHARPMSAICRSRSSRAAMTTF